MLERTCIERGQFAELLPLVVAAALMEAIFLSLLECPEDLTLPALDELCSSSLSALERPRIRMDATSPPILDRPLHELDDTTAISVRAAMLPFEPAGSSLAEEAVTLQLRAGDEDTLVELSRVAAHLTDTQLGNLILHHLGHQDLRRMLRPHGSLPSVAPLLTSFSDASLARRTVAAVLRALSEGVPLAHSFAYSPSAPAQHKDR